MKGTKGVWVPAYAHGYGEGSFGERLADAWGHFAAELLCVCILVAVYLGIRPPHGAFALTLPLALVLLVLSSWLMMRRHDRRLCEQCAASMPLDAAAVAARFQRRFWMAHTGANRRFMIPYLVMLVSTNFATGTTLGRIAWAFVQLSMVYLILSHTTHRRLQPWCPWCSEGGGGTHRDEDAPDPVLPRDRVLV